MKHRLSSPLLLALALSVGCTGATGNPEPSAEPEHMHDDMLHLHMEYENLPELGPDYVYEAFTVHDDGMETSIGRFQADADQQVFGFDTMAHNLEHAVSLLISIEPNDDDAAERNGPVLLANDFDEDGEAHLHIMDSRALGMFPMPSGGFIADTPSTTPGGTSGVWFFDRGSTLVTLVLPTLPDDGGWAYEGWVIVGETARSTGRFFDPAGADEDGPGDHAGLTDGHPSPGQDFTDPELDITQADEVAITLEPVDDLTAPFPIKLLSAAPAGADAVTPTTMAPWAMPPFEGHAMIAEAGSHDMLHDDHEHED